MLNKNKETLRAPIRFSPSLNLWQAIARSLGVIVASVAFILLGDAVTAAGPQVPLAILLTTLLMLLNSLGYAELAVNASRPDGAYALVHNATKGNSLAFLTGWALALSGLGACSLLAQGAASHLALLLSDFLDLTVPADLLAMGLLALAALESGLGGWSRRRLPFTLPMMILLIALALLATPRLPAADYATAYSQPGPAMTLLTAAFIGLEIVANHQRELRRRATNLPRALLLTSALAAVAGVGLAAAAGSHAAEVTGAPLAPLGESIAGTLGSATVLAVGGIVLMLSLRQVLRMVVRHLYVMSQDGFWPAWLRQTHLKVESPTRIILLVGILAMPIVWIPTGLLAPVGGLLYLLVLMAVNLTLARRPRQAKASSFALPFHPWIPALTLAVDVLVIPLWGLVPAICTLGCLIVGAMIYLLYGRSHHIEAQEGVTVFRPPVEEHATDRFCVLVPIANPNTASALLRMAGCLAQFQGGSVLALQVVTVPDPVPLEAGSRRAEAGRAILEKALAIANEKALPIQTMTRVARSVAQGILDTAIEENAGLIVLGWERPTRLRGASLGQITDAVLQDAPCDVLVMQGEHAERIRKILVPTTGGPHAQAAARLATLLMKALQAKVTLLHVQSELAIAKQMEENRREIAETLEDLSTEPLPEEKVVIAKSVAEGIIQEAKEHDLVLLGVSDETLLDQLVFGSIPLQVAARAPQTALVQGYQGVTRIWTRRLLRALRQTLPVLSAEEQRELQQELRRGAQPGVNFFVLTVLSCLIAALGLLLNSPAVVIGAMLVAPLMSPIMALSLGLVVGDLRAIRLSTEAILKGVALAVVIAAFIGLVSPLKTITGEMHARAQPTLLDLIVALVSGMAGAYAVARKEVGAALPGVAIAAALMPPLATVGLGLSLGNAWVAGGALLLFAANIAAISLAAGVVFFLLGIRPQIWGPESRRQLWRWLAVFLVVLMAIAVPLGMIMVGIVREATQERIIEAVLIEHLATEEGQQLVALEITEEATAPLIVATIRSPHLLDEERVNDLAQAVSERLGRPVQLEVVTLLIIRSE
ncbi:MAG: TIGR00341 family protein [Anaerolineae bacterium]|nr:TIGR00341 family protein [Anaerolineae bacterium]